MKRYLYRLLIFAMSLITIWCAGFLWFGTGALTTPQATATQAKADAIVVLTGGQNRIEEGFYLFSVGRAKNLFISGVNKDVTAEELRGLWQGAPLPACCMDIGYSATNTWGNATETKEWFEKNQIRSAFLVTSDYHMPRARLEFSYAVPDVKIYPHPVYYDRNDGTLKFLKLLIGEYHKTVATYFRNFVTGETPE